MARFPFCIIDDVQQHNQSRKTYDESSTPSSVHVLDFMDNVSDEIRSVASTSGYDIDNLHEVSSTVALAVTAGTGKAVIVASEVGFAAGDQVFYSGVASGVRVYGYTYLTGVTAVSHTLTLANVTGAMDAGTCTIYLVNSAIRVLRSLNAIGAAAFTEQAAYLGTSQDKSEHAEALWAQYYGSEEIPVGLWAIRNTPNYLLGASVTSTASHRDTIVSYGSEHSTDDDVEAVFTRETEF
jgi:hypothetical protein